MVPWVDIVNILVLVILRVTYLWDTKFQRSLPRFIINTFTFNKSIPTLELLHTCHGIIALAILTPRVRVAYLLSSFGLILGVVPPFPTCQTHKTSHLGNHALLLSISHTPFHFACIYVYTIGILLSSSWEIMNPSYVHPNLKPTSFKYLV